MAYLINGTVIPNPKKFTHNFIETVAQNELIFGKTTKRYQLRKRQYVLEFQNLTTGQVATIESLYTAGVPVTFQVTEQNLQVGPIQCFMDITDRTFQETGKHWLETLKVGLMEIK